MEKRAVIFDLDGTLLDTVASLAASGNRMLHALGFPPQPEEAYKTFAGDGADVLVRRLLAASGDKEGTQFQTAAALYREGFRELAGYRVRPYDGVPALLGRLKDAGLRLAVLSNKPHDRTREVVDAFFPPGTFEVAEGARDGRPVKPHPAGLCHVLRLLGLEAGDCAYVGDTDVDMQTGTGAGMLTIGVLWGFRGREELSAHGADHLVKHPLELLDIL